MSNVSNNEVLVISVNEKLRLGTLTQNIQF